MRDVSVKDTPKRDLLRPRLLSTPTPHASHFRCVARAFSLNERALGAHGASALPARGPRRNGAAQAAGVPGRGPGRIASFSLPDASLKSSEGPDPTGGVLGPEGTGPGLTRKKCARSAVSWTLAWCLGGLLSWVQEEADMIEPVYLSLSLSDFPAQ